jgi:hypothetical protein
MEMEMKCIRVNNDNGVYSLIPAATPENFDQVRKGDVDCFERVGDLKGWGEYNAVYTIESRGKEQTYFVCEEPRNFYIEVSGRLDRETARLLDILNSVVAMNADDALLFAAGAVWQKAGWENKEDCLAHIAINCVANDR